METNNYVFDDAAEEELLRSQPDVVEESTIPIVEDIAAKSAANRGRKNLRQYRAALALKNRLGAIDEAQRSPKEIEDLKWAARVIDTSRKHLEKIEKYKSANPNFANTIEEEVMGSESSKRQRSLDENSENQESKKGRSSEPKPKICTMADEVKENLLVALIDHKHPLGQMVLEDNDKTLTYQPVTGGF